MTMRNLAIFLILIIASCSQKTVNDWELVSPDGTLTVKVKLDEQTGSLGYEVYKGQTQVIEPSVLGLTFEEADFSKNLSFVSVSEPGLIDEKYSMVTGKQKEYHNLANQRTIDFKNW